MLRNKNTNEKGFTIIEVVITIAIGAAVMALVLNAVAGARRSQRNNARSSDVNLVVAAVNQYIASRNKLPGQWSDINTIVETDKFGHYSTNPIPASTATTNMGVVGAAGSFWTSETSSTTNPTTLTTIATRLSAVLHNSTPVGWGTDVPSSYDQFHLVQKVGCNADKTDMVSGGIREMAILYRLEGQDITCQEV